MSSLLVNTIYINLDNRIDRKEHVENEFKKVGITPIRFSAIKNSYGPFGCTRSHIGCLMYAIQNNLDTIFICEDDITFLQPDVFLNSLQQFELLQKEWDVCIVSGNNFQPFDIKNEWYIQVTNCQCGTGYIVKKHYYQTLLQNFIEGLKQFEQTRAHWYFALDQYWKQLQRKDKWFMLTPATVIQYASYSDLENKDVDYSDQMLIIDKK